MMEMSPQGFLFSIILVHFQTAGTNGRLTVDSVIATKKTKNKHTVRRYEAEIRFTFIFR